MTFSREQASAREEPSEEIHGGNSHADAEKHASKNALGPALPESERQPRHDDRHERKTAGDGTREGLLQDIDGVFPRGIRLRKSGSREGQSQKKTAKETSALKTVQRSAK